MIDVEAMQPETRNWTGTPPGGTGVESTDGNDLSGKLAEYADAWIDLRRPATDGEYLMTHLAKRYEDIFSPFISIASENPSAIFPILKIIVKQLSLAQADIFALKSAVLGRDKLVLTQDWNYRDPIHAYYETLGQIGRSAVMDFRRYSLPLDSNVMGFGWYPTEEADSAVWRWSGPGLTSGLMVPGIFNCPVSVHLFVRVINKSVFPEEGFIFVNGMPVNHKMVFSDDNQTQGEIYFEINLDNDTSPFFMLEFRLARTISPQEEFGASDQRYLGVCLLKIEVEQKMR